MNRYFQTPPVVKNLIIINVLVYMATALLPVGNEIIRFCALWFGASPFGEFHSYQFVTYMFLHASVEHIFSTCSHCGCSAGRWSTSWGRSVF